MAVIVLIIIARKSIITSDDHQAFLNAASLIERNWDEISKESWELESIEGVGFSNEVYVSLSIKKRDITSEKNDCDFMPLGFLEERIKKAVMRSSKKKRKLKLQLNVK